MKVMEVHLQIRWENLKNMASINNKDLKQCGNGYRKNRSSIKSERRSWAGQHIIPGSQGTSSQDRHSFGSYTAKGKGV